MGELVHLEVDSCWWHVEEYSGRVVSVTLSDGTGAGVILVDQLIDVLRLLIDGDRLLSRLAVPFAARPGPVPRPPCPPAGGRADPGCAAG
jgi:hypothetical protein